MISIVSTTTFHRRHLYVQAAAAAAEAMATKMAELNAEAASQSVEAAALAAKVLRSSSWPACPPPLHSTTVFAPPHLTLYQRWCPNAIITMASVFPYDPMPIHDHVSPPPAPPPLRLQYEGVITDLQAQLNASQDELRVYKKPADTVKQLGNKAGSALSSGLGALKKLW